MDDNELLRLADQCVKCGLCLPHCPTFGLRRDEADSPRGRIALIQGLATGRLEEGPRLAAHLDGCLECRACEVACPSLVRFGDIMDAARARRVAGLPAWRRGLRRLRLDLLSSLGSLRVLAPTALLYRRLGAAMLGGAFGLLRLRRLKVLHGLLLRLRRPDLPPVSGRTDGKTQAVPATVPSLALFRGCVARSLEPEVATAALRVFAALGVVVQVPEDQVCCGAMHRHNGFPDAADGLLGRNRTAFGDARVVGTASACVAELQPALNAVELCRALLDLPWPASVQVHALRGRAVVHEPCSHRNLLRDTGAVYELLARIPELEVMPLPDNERCCGAAGTYLLDQPAMSERLVSAKVDALVALRPRWLVTTNTGCAAHLGAAATDAGLDLEVLHPAVLLARALSP